MIEGGSLFITGATRDLDRAFVQTALRMGAARSRPPARDPANLAVAVSLAPAQKLPAQAANR